VSTGPQMHDEDNYVASFFSDPSYRQRACEHLADSMKEREQVQALDGVLDQSEEMATFLLSYGDFRHDRLCPVRAQLQRRSLCSPATTAMQVCQRSPT
jgi:hypothetical protein